MDDFQLSTLNDARSEYSAILISKITPCIIQGIFSIFKEAVALCEENDEDEKYLMTFQNFLTRVPKWNQDIVNKETERIIHDSGCSFLEDLLSCVHITQLKILTSIRVGQKQKKIDINIPKVNEFIHKVYIDVARRIYKNVYIFDKNVPSLQRQKNIRECELFVKESILHVIREGVPIEHILRSYLDETTEEDVEELKEEVEEIVEAVGEPEKIQQNIVEDTVKENVNRDGSDDEEKTTNHETENRPIKLLENHTQEGVNVVPSLAKEQIHTNTNTNNSIFVGGNKQEGESDDDTTIKFRDENQIQRFDRHDTVETIQNTPIETVKDEHRKTTLTQNNDRYQTEDNENGYDSDDDKIQIVSDGVNLKLDDDDILSVGTSVHLNDTDILLDDIEVLA